MEQQILSFIRQHGLVQPGEHVIAAVSGGADSMALLSALLQLREPLGITVSAAHFHHGIRGEAADRDAEFVRAWCQAQGIDCVIGHGDAPAHARRTGKSLEEAARELRFSFLLNLDADKIATAHNADDNAETMLPHLLRGTGLRGMGGIAPQSGRVIHPLLPVTRAEIEAYLKQNGIPHIEDETNAGDDCVRNRLRHHVLPLLKAENPGFLQTAARTGALLRQEDAYLSGLAAKAGADCRDADGWSCSRLCALDPVLRRRVLLSVLRGLDLENPSAVHLEALDRLVCSPAPSAGVTLPEGWRAARVYDRLVIRRAEAPQSCPTRQLNVPGETLLPEISAKIVAIVTENSNFPQKNDFTFALRCDRIAANVWSVRSRQPGDRLLLPGGHRTLKKLMIDRRIPKSQRDALPVILCGDQIAGVLGLAVSEDFRPLPDQPVLLLNWTQNPSAANPGT